MHDAKVHQIEQKRDKFIKEESSDSQESYDSNVEFKVEQIKEVKSNEKLKEDNALEEQPDIKSTGKISALLKMIKSSRGSKTKSNEEMSRKNTAKIITNESIDQEDIIESAVDTSGVTDIEMMLEGHQDMLQFIHIMAQVSEVNF